MRLGAPHPRRRRPRRYGFLALLLLALAAPAGFVAAGESSSHYVVLFRTDDGQCAACGADRTWRASGFLAAATSDGNPSGGLGH